MRYVNVPTHVEINGLRVSKFWLRLASGEQALNQVAWARKDEAVALDALLAAGRASRAAREALAHLAPHRSQALREVAAALVDDEERLAQSVGHSEQS